jgi:diguanylate cyclase (GGDEF)-like protein/PAS domain S-box-containing protein
LSNRSLFPTKSETVKQEEELYWQYAKDTVLPLLRMIMIFAVVVQIMFMFEDWYATPDFFAQLFKAKLISIAVLIAAYMVSVSQRGKKYLELSLIIVALTLVANISFQASIIGATFMMPLVAILVTFISASLFPWKLRYHVLVTIICVTGVALNMMSMQEPPYLPLTREAMSGVVFPVASIFLAIFAQRRRFDLWHAERTLRESEERFRQLAEHSPDIIWIWSPDRRIQYVSPAYTRYTGRDPEVLYGSPRKALEIIRKDDRAAYGKALEDIMQGKTRKMDLHVCHTDGSEFFLEGWGAPIKDDSGKIIRCIGIWRDVTERIRLIEDLDAMATSDDLTKAHNRRYFFNAVEKEAKRTVRKQMPLSLILFDIDKFKDINDSYGHHSGDLVLVEISNVCKKMLRGEDTFARIGGEEFVVMLPDTDDDEAATIAERIRHLISELIVTDRGKTIAVTVSIGVTSWNPGRGLDINTLLNEADQAMYHAKSSGRNKVSVYSAGAARNHTSPVE